MNPDHAALIAELRALALTTLDRLEPMLERAASGAGADGPDSEQAAPPAAAAACAWCPVCALVALARGEQHELVTLVSAQLMALLALVRALLAEHGGDITPVPSPPEPASTTPSRNFVPIQVDIDDNRSS